MSEMKPTHLDLFSGIGGFAIAAQNCGYNTVGFCEREPYAQDVLRKHWPEVPICEDIKILIERLTGLPSDEYIARYVTPAITKIRPGSSDVSVGTFDSGHCELFPSNEAGNVGYSTPTGSEVQDEHKKRNGESFSPRNESNRPSAKPARESNREGLTNEGDCVSAVQEDSAAVQEWTHSDTSAPLRLWKTSGCDVALPTMPSRLAQKQQSERLQLGEISLLTAGVPCQPASVAGKRRGTNDDRWLWPETFAVIHATRPAWVILENVLGILALEQGMAFEHLCLTLESFGYEVQPLVIPACAVDAKHRRDRVWIVAYRTGAGLERQQREKHKGRGNGLANEGENVAHSDEPFSEGDECTERAGPERAITGKRCQWRDEGEWFAESGLGRVAHGIPNRAHRLRGLGNSIVPQVAEEIIRAIRNVNESL